MALKLKSNNNQGNPYHDEEGKFTSKGGEGNKTEKPSDPLMDLFGSLGESMRKTEAEEKEASRLLGVDVSEPKTWQVDPTDPEMDEFLKLDSKGRRQAREEGRLPKQFEKLDKATIGSLMAGYDEAVTDAPWSVKISDTVASGPQSYNEDYDEYAGNEEEVSEEIDVSTDDVIDFLKVNKVNLSSEDEQLIRDNHVIPTRILKEEFGDKYTEDDLYDDLVDFKRR